MKRPKSVSLLGFTGFTEDVAHFIGVAVGVVDFCSFCIGSRGAPSGFITVFFFTEFFSFSFWFIGSFTWFHWDPSVDGNGRFLGVSFRRRFVGCCCCCCCCRCCCSFYAPPGAMRASRRSSRCGRWGDTPMSPDRRKSAG